MASKSNTSPPADAQQVFRQFAWNIAGTLNGLKSTKSGARKPRAAAASRRRSATK